MLRLANRITLCAVLCFFYSSLAFPQTPTFTNGSFETPAIADASVSTPYTIDGWWVDGYSAAPQLISNTTANYGAAPQGRQQLNLVANPPYAYLGNPVAMQTYLNLPAGVYRLSIAARSNTGGTGNLTIKSNNNTILTAALNSNWQTDLVLI